MGQKESMDVFFHSINELHNKRFFKCFILSLEIQSDFLGGCRTGPSFFCFQVEMIELMTFKSEVSLCIGGHFIPWCGYQECFFTENYSGPFNGPVCLINHTAVENTLIIEDHEKVPKQSDCNCNKECDCIAVDEDTFQHVTSLALGCACS